VTPTLGRSAPKSDNDLEELPVESPKDTTTFDSDFHGELRSTSEHSLEPTESSSQRSGLPRDFIPKRNRYGRTRLLEENIYRLPDGREFVPCVPSGALGGNGHQYALLSATQHDQGQRGSVYIRNDGRIFDYSDSKYSSQRDLFDTGFTIADLERTGRYASRSEGKRLRAKQKAKSRASHGS
jgi:hypothetical protein